MEIALALIYVLLQIMPADTQSFTMHVTPESSFHGTKQNGNVWCIETAKADTKSFFGDAYIKNRQLIIKTKKGDIPFAAADKLALPESVDCKTLKEVGSSPVIYEINSKADKIEFIITIEGAERPQPITAIFKP